MDVGCERLGVGRPPADNHWRVVTRGQAVVLALCLWHLVGVVHPVVVDLETEIPVLVEPFERVPGPPAGGLTDVGCRPAEVVNTADDDRVFVVPAVTDTSGESEHR